MALASLRICADSPEPLLLDDAISEVCIDPNLEFLRMAQNILWWFLLLMPCTEKLVSVDHLRTAQKINLYRIGVCA